MLWLFWIWGGVVVAGIVASVLRLVRMSRPGELGLGVVAGSVGIDGHRFDSSALSTRCGVRAGGVHASWPVAEMMADDTHIRIRSVAIDDIGVDRRLARKLDAPLLLTAKTALDVRTRAEIERLGATNAVLLGGLGALSAAVEQELQSMGLTTERIAGPNRFDTARRIGERLPSTTVYVTEGGHADPTRGWADAVSVSGLAAFEQRPILLVTKDRAPDATLQALREQGATEIVIVGGTGAVSEATARALADYVPGGSPEASIVRIAGSSRYATSVAVAERSIAAGASLKDLWFATGLSFPDALTAGPAVARSGGVLVLVHGRSSSAGQEVYEFLSDIDRAETQRAWFVGGTGAITDAVATRITDTLGFS